jgi:glucose/arabinose dehydrogenase
MKKVLRLTIWLVILKGIVIAQSVNGPLGEKFSVRVVASKLSDPWEITYGPDNVLWVTESKGYLVSRIHPATGEKTVILDLNAERQFPRYDKMGKTSGGKPAPQGGLMGMALHPQLLNGKPFVYLMYVYHFDGADKPGSGCAINYGGCRFRGRIVRYQYDQRAQRLQNPVILCDSIPQSNDHNGGRLALAPVNGKLYLFYSIGDMGAGQLATRVSQTTHRIKLIMKEKYCASTRRQITILINMINGYPMIIPLMAAGRTRFGAMVTVTRKGWTMQ